VLWCVQILRRSFNCVFVLPIKGSMRGVWHPNSSLISKVGDNYLFVTKNFHFFCTINGEYSVLCFQFWYNNPSAKSTDTYIHTRLCIQSLPVPMCVLFIAIPLDFYCNCRVRALFNLNFYYIKKTIYKSFDLKVCAFHWIWYTFRVRLELNSKLYLFYLLLYII